MHGIVAKFIGLSFVAISLSGCAWWDAKERELVYRPSPGRPADFKGLRTGDEAFFVQLPAHQPDRPDQLSMWWMPQHDPKAPALLYLHGTFRSLYKNLPKIEALRDAGFSVLAVDYRGWGESTFIIPSEESILADAQAAWQEFKRRQPDPARRVLFGHSMGGGVAIALASRLHYRSDYAALITESTFTDLPDVAAAAGAIGTLGSWITRQRFESVNKISLVDAPILMLHGQADKTVPVALGRKLRDAARPGLVRWVEFPNGSHSRLHSDAPQQYREAVQSVLATLPAQTQASAPKPTSQTKPKPP